MPHNVVIFDGPDAEAPALVHRRADHRSRDGRLRGRAACAEGEYFFNCEVHPTTMAGTMTAAPGGGGGGGGEGVTVVAANLAFDTDTIELPADVETTITFDNQDAGTPHNIAIYADDSLDEELFKGELVTGPVSVNYDDPAAAGGRVLLPVRRASRRWRHRRRGRRRRWRWRRRWRPAGGGEEPPDERRRRNRPTAAAPRRVGRGRGHRVRPDDARPGRRTPRSRSRSTTGTPPTSTGQHNVSIYDGDTALFQGELVVGAATVDYTIPPMEPGTFEFRCDVHPTMVGTVEVT